MSATVGPADRAPLHFESSLSFSLRHSLEGNLARAVFAGHIDLTNADIAIMNASLAAHRNSTHQSCNCDPLDCARLRHHTLRQAVKRLESDAGYVTAGIRRALQPMLLRRLPINQILAEAHNVNGQYAFPFTEEQVSDVVHTVLLWHQRKRHGG